MNFDMQMDHDLSGDFNDSIIIDPISIKSQVQPTLFSHLNNGQNTDFGPYNEIKLTKFLDFITDYPQKAVQLVTIDPTSYFLELSTEGTQLLQMYASHDVVFCGVIGERQVGKSLFLDKMYNLAGIRGNHFSSVNKPGIHVYSMPFSKGNLKIFFAQMVTSQAMGAVQYNTLTKAMLLLCSSIILINDIYSNKSIVKDFEKIVKSSLSDVFLKQTNLINKNNCNILPNLLINLDRKQNLQLLQEFHSQFFDSVKFQFLNDAMSKKFVGNIRQLAQVSFLADNCIDSTYIRNIANAFNIVFMNSRQKKYNGLVFNGNICQKVLNAIVSNINHHRSIQCQKMFSQLTRELYISAFNLCVMLYQEQLQKEFQNEEPKSLDKILEIFQESSLSVLSKYNQFNLQPQLHLQFEQKLISHIDQKQRMIIDINNKKGARIVQKLFNDANFNDPSLISSNFLAIQKKTVQSQGRDLALSQKLVQVLKGLGSQSNNVDYRIMKQIEKLNNDKKLKQRELEVMKKSNEQFYRQQNAKNDQMQNLNKQIRQIQKKISLAKSELERIRNKQMPDSKKYEDSLRNATQQSVKNFKIITQLEQELKKQQFLANVKSQRQNAISQIVQKQNKIQTQLREIQANNNGQAMKENKEAKVKQPKQFKKNSKQQEKRNSIQDQPNNVQGSQVKRQGNNVQASQIKKQGSNVQGSQVKRSNKQK